MGGGVPEVRAQVGDLRPVTRWATAALLALGLVAVGLVMVVRRRGEDVAAAVVGAGRALLAVSAGWLILASGWSLGNHVAGWILGRSTGVGEYRREVEEAVSAADPVVALTLSIVGIACCLGFVSAVLVRLVVAVLIVVGMPVIAAGSLFGARALRTVGCLGGGGHRVRTPQCSGVPGGSCARAQRPGTGTRVAGGSGDLVPGREHAAADRAARGTWAMNADVRTYGGWRERRGFGVAGLSGTQTGLALAGVVVCLATALVRPQALMVMAVPLLALVALVAMRVRGEPVAAVLGRHGRFQWVRRRGGLSFRGSESGRLPGVLADAHVIDATDGAGRGVGMFWSPGRRTLTALVPLEPWGPDLVDTDDIAGWVSGWSDWLAHLGYAPLLEHVAVTIRTAPTGQPARTVMGITVGQAARSALDQATAALFDALSGAPWSRCLWHVRARALEPGGDHDLGAPGLRPGRGGCRRSGRGHAPDRGGRGMGDLPPRRLALRGLRVA